jgi:hypothetical protein
MRREFSEDIRSKRGVKKKRTVMITPSMRLKLGPGLNFTYLSSPSSRAAVTSIETVYWILNLALRREAQRLDSSEDIRIRTFQSFDYAYMILHSRPVESLPGAGNDIIL